MDESACFDTAVFSGGGLFGEDELEEQPCDTSSSQSSDTAESSGWIGGGFCNSAPASPGLGWLILLLVWVRRVAPVVLVFLGLADVARAYDAQTLTVTDGGPFLTLQEHHGGQAGSLRTLAALHSGFRPVQQLTGEGPQPLIVARTTLELAASLALSDSVRVGVRLPLHHNVWAGDAIHPPALGDLGVWFTAPLRQTARGTLAMTADGEVGTGSAAELARAPGFGLGVSWLSSGETQGYGLQARLSVQEVERLPSLEVGNYLIVSGGYRIGSMRKGWTLEAQAYLPAGGTSGRRAAWPAELLLHRALSINGVTARVGAGVGLTQGVGAPTARGLVLVQRSGDEDIDGDGFVGLRDLCSRRPEDVDSFKDADGCPDPDNDEDGILDLSDACPLERETFNGHEDEDGCPDDLSRLGLLVTSDVPDVLELVRVDVPGYGIVEVFPDETVWMTLPSGALLLDFTAADHQPGEEVVYLEPDTEQRVLLRLEAIRRGAIRVDAVDTLGETVKAAVDCGDGLHLSGRPWTREVGDVTCRVAAPGLRQVVVQGEVTVGETAVLSVTLHPAAVRVTNGGLELGAELLFETDTAVLEDTLLIEELSGWLADNPWVTLLRVEGQADGVGTSAHNHLLSVRRAEAVRDALVDAGVAPERLQAIGAGETYALDASDDAEQRAVRFRILVWDEDTASVGFARTVDAEP